MTVDRVLVSGASGGTGREVLDVLGRADRTVRATTHSPRELPELEPRVDEVVVADRLDADDAARAVARVHAVVTTFGSSPWQVLGVGSVILKLVDGWGNVNLVDAATAAGAERFAMRSSLGVAGDSASLLTRSFRLAVVLALAAKAKAEAAVRASGLHHTILRWGSSRTGRRPGHPGGARRDGALGSDPAGRRGRVPRCVAPDPGGGRPNAGDRHQPAPPGRAAPDVDWQWA